MAHIAFHALSVGGGVLAISQLPGLGGDYQGDLEDIREWQPSIVLTLVTSGELADFGAETLGSEIRARAARWEHLPITDFGVPDATFEAAWPDVAEKVLMALKGGGRVLVHCKGGCGRSGMVALRLMMEAGEHIEEALGHLRAVRPCAIETDAQYEWAQKGRRRKLPRPGGLHCS
ncbi:dual specificity protein phosphatase family protein [Cognatishimia activa]|uniref:dual specificity protein phosphatase family protein n=1 Tax=Cognatishimia activa TaxID=1715691 RepID=UPI00222EE27A|nr:dual specificity protein phosphatase family protein [Cognatishimia activa]UZD90255.1 dual specificity protein phosphatase family protein [Cognatishimia activa]